MDKRRQTLGSLSPGKRGIVLDVGEGPARRRLLEMGILPGTPLAVLRRAPLGEPIQVAVRGTWLCLRQDEADAVTVAVAP